MTTLCDQINEQKLTGTPSRCPRPSSTTPRSTDARRATASSPARCSSGRRRRTRTGKASPARCRSIAGTATPLSRRDLRSATACWPSSIRVTRVDLDGVRKLKEEFGVVSGDLSVTAHQQLASHFAKLEKDRALLKDRIAATEAKLACLRTADRAMARQPATRPPATALADSLPGWEPSGSLDQESCVRR